MSKINVEKYREVNESKAFNELKRVIMAECQDRFDEFVNSDSGWNESENIDNMTVSLKKNISRIGNKDCDEVDYIDSINFIIFLYNLHDERDKNK